MEKLVESLSSDVTGEMDSTYVSVFFATYRSASITNIVCIL